MKVFLIILMGIFGLVILQAYYLAWVVRWNDHKTDGLIYFGKSNQSRKRFKFWLGVHRTLLSPWISFLSRVQKFELQSGTFIENELALPKGTCTPTSLKRALEYEPTDQDVFVVSQMKSGTTWLQQIAIQVLNRGETYVCAARPLGEVSSWIESKKTVGIEDAPRIGESSKRVVKSHLPLSHCPFNRQAKYIYIARHPVSCFASCVDFLNGNLGPFSLDVPDYRDWFLGDQMWFGSWSDHVSGWWNQSNREPNTLFLRFEDLKTDFGRAVDQVAEFLNVPKLSKAEKCKIVENCSFESMKKLAGAFEMYPPQLFKAKSHFFVSGAKYRFRDVPTGIATEIAEASVLGLEANGIEASMIYPELVDGKRSELSFLGSQPSSEKSMMDNEAHLVHSIDQT